MKVFIKELLKDIFTDPKIIREILEFIKDLISKGYTREQTIGMTATQYNIPIDVVTRIVDYIIEKLGKIKK